MTRTGLRTPCRSNGAVQLNLWIPDPPPKRDAVAEEALRRFLNDWGPEVTPEAGSITPPDFEAQCEAMLEAGPQIISSIMGLYSDSFVARMKTKGVKWFATVTSVSEAKYAEAAGADVIIAQGMEAGGHRGAFDATKAEARMVGLFSLLPAVVDAVKVPVVAAGGIADGRGVGAALLLGASAVQCVGEWRGGQPDDGKLDEATAVRVSSVFGHGRLLVSQVRSG
jgi:nitronate monooxygenase